MKSSRERTGLPSGVRLCGLSFGNTQQGMIRNGLRASRQWRTIGSVAWSGCRPVTTEQRAKSSAVSASSNGGSAAQAVGVRDACRAVLRGRTVHVSSLSTLPMLIVAFALLLVLVLPLLLPLLGTSLRPTNSALKRHRTKNMGTACSNSRIALSCAARATSFAMDRCSHAVRLP